MIMAVKQFASEYGDFLCPNLYTLDFIICRVFILSKILYSAIGRNGRSEMLLYF